MAEVSANKISKKSLGEREDYFNALRTVLQDNLPRSEVSATSSGVVVAKGNKLYTVRLTDKAWTLQVGATGKVKKIGTTFDIVDLLGMMDKGILSPKPKTQAEHAPQPQPELVKHPTVEKEPIVQNMAVPDLARAATDHLNLPKAMATKLAELPKDNGVVSLIRDIIWYDKEIDLSKVTILEDNRLLTQTSVGTLEYEPLGEEDDPTVVLTNPDNAWNAHTNDYTNANSAKMSFRTLLREIQKGKFSTFQQATDAFDRYEPNNKYSNLLAGQRHNWKKRKEDDWGDNDSITDAYRW